MPEKGRVNQEASDRCRYCGRRIARSDPGHARFWPFCSERCKMAELGLWFQDRYVISRPVDQVADDAAARAPPAKAGKKSKAAGKPNSS